MPCTKSQKRFQFETSHGESNSLATSHNEAGGTECCVLPHYPINAHSASSDEKAPFTYQDKDGASGLSGAEDY